MSPEPNFAIGFDEPETADAELPPYDAEATEAAVPRVSPPGVDSHDRPDAPGWSSAATAIRSLRRMTTPMLLVLEPVGYGQIVIDSLKNEYHWGVPLENFPTEPASVSVYTAAVPESDPLAISPAAHNLDGLLWKIGLNSFAGELAWWLPEGERYHVTRWPNLTELVHTWVQLRTIAMLANTFFTPAELTAASASSPSDARRLLNALSLMGILESSSTEPEPVPRAEPEAAPSRGLFQRLLDRLTTHA